MCTYVDMCNYEERVKVSQDSTTTTKQEETRYKT